MYVENLRLTSMNVLRRCCCLILHLIGEPRYSSTHVECSVSNPNFSHPPLRAMIALKFLFILSQNAHLCPMSKLEKINFPLYNRNNCENLDVT